MPERNKRNNMPNILIEVEVTISEGLADELGLLIHACKGDNPDRFGRLNYWKCMLTLIPSLLKDEITLANVIEISRNIGFSKDQVIRSLNRFVEKGILIRTGRGSYSVWKLEEKRIPALYFLCRRKKLTHIVRHWLTYNAVEDISYSQVIP
jgi:hypothetical protein